MLPKDHHHLFSNFCLALSALSALLDSSFPLNGSRQHTSNSRQISILVNVHCKTLLSNNNAFPCFGRRLTATLQLAVPQHVDSSALRQPRLRLYQYRYPSGHAFPLSALHQRAFASTSSSAFQDTLLTSKPQTLGVHEATI